MGGTSYGTSTKSTIKVINNLFKLPYIIGAWVFRVALTFHCMKEKIDIKNYNEQLKQLCNNCQRAPKCKMKDDICYAKWLAFKIAKIKYARDSKKAR